MIVRSLAASRRGITLMEMLVSMAIFLLSVAALTQLLNMGSNSAIDAIFRNDATRLLQSKLAEVEAGALTPDAVSSGSFDNDPSWSWQMDTSPMSVPNVYLVTITVSRTLGRPMSLSRTQMIYDSRQMGKASELNKPDASMTAGM